MSLIGIKAALKKIDINGKRHYFSTKIEGKDIIFSTDDESYKYLVDFSKKNNWGSELKVISNTKHNKNAIRLDIYFELMKLDFYKPTVVPEIEIHSESNQCWMSLKSFVGYFDSEEKMGTLLITSGDYPLVAINNYLRTILALTLIKEDYLFLHSSGALHKKKGYCFFGPQDAGKTTISNLIKEKADIISDDLVFIKKEKNGKFYLIKSFLRAWDSKENKAELDSLFYIKKSPKVKFTKLTKTEALSKILTQVMFSTINEAYYNKILSLCIDLVDKHSCYEMYFRKDDALFWDQIENGRHL